MTPMSNQQPNALALPTLLGLAEHIHRTIRIRLVPICLALAHAVVISDAQMAYILTFSYLLDPKVKLMIQPRCYTCNLNSKVGVKPYIPQIPDGFSDVFLYNHTPSPKWIDELKKQPKYKLELVYNSPDDQLWKLEKQ